MTMFKIISEKYNIKKYITGLPVLFFCILANASSEFQDNSYSEEFNVPFRFSEYYLPLNKYIEFLAKDSGYKYTYTENNCLSEEYAESGFNHNQYTNTTGARLNMVALKHSKIATFQVDLNSKQIILSCK
jgi:hypothetical protein